MIILFVLGWFACGLLGIALLRLSYVMDFGGRFWCLSPFHYVSLLFLSILGPLLLFVSCVVFLITVDWSKTSLQDQWFFKPICKND